MSFLLGNFQELKQLLAANPDGSYCWGFDFSANSIFFCAKLSSGAKSWPIELMTDGINYRIEFGPKDNEKIRGHTLRELLENIRDSGNLFNGQKLEKDACRFPKVRSAAERQVREHLMRRELLLARAQIQQQGAQIQQQGAQIQQERVRADRERDRADRLERQLALHRESAVIDGMVAARSQQQQQPTDDDISEAERLLGAGVQDSGVDRGAGGNGGPGGNNGGASVD